jgi:hypothetical protein
MNKILLLLGIVLLGACDGSNPSPATGAATTAQGEPATAASRAAAPALVKTCNVETADKQSFKPGPPVLRVDSRVRFTGWAIDATAHGIPVKPTLRMISSDGVIVSEAPIGMWRDRADVVAANGGDEAYLKSGFSVDVDTKDLAPGTYSITLGYTADPAVACDVGRRVELR